MDFRNVRGMNGWRLWGARPRPVTAAMARVPAGWVRTPSGRRWVWGFELDLRPVTNREWLAFIQERGVAAPPWMFRRGFDAPEQPVVGVTLDEAHAFARWAGKRLPKEREWLRAVGLERYPWGAREADAGRAIFGKRAEQPGAPEAGERRAGAGPFGHLDLVGNCWEWLAEGVGRGGFWGSADPCVSERVVLARAQRSSGVGLRLAR